MPGCSFPELLGAVTNGRTCLPTASLDSIEYTGEEDGSSSLLHADFIRFFLNFLRESSSTVVKGPDLDSSALHNGAEIANVTSAALHNGGTENPTVRASLQMMSTPKVRDDVMNPKSYHNLSTSSLRTPVGHKTAGRNSGFSEPRKQNTRSGTKPKREPLSLSDFMSPEAGHPSMHSTSKKRSQKRGRRAQLAPASDGSVHRPVNSPSFSHRGLSYSPRLTNVADAKSPVNPLFSEASRNISFDVEEEFPALSSASLQLPSNNKPTRRIKPTIIRTEPPVLLTEDLGLSGVAEERGNIRKNGLDCSSNPFTSAPSVAPSPGKELTKERGLLLKMKTKTKNLEFSVEEKSTTTPVKALEEISPVKKCNVDLDPRLIRDRLKVDRISGLYAYFISCFLVPNIISEIQFIVDLLTVTLSTQKTENRTTGLSITGSLCNSSESNAEDTTDKTSSNSDLLSTAANCVYFAATVMETLVSSGIFAILSRSTLSLLAQNQRIQAFSPRLPGQILSLSEQLELKEKEISAEIYGSGEKLHSMSSVMFEAETDDRSNFPSDKTFHAFRKHRDLFYVIVREYEEKRHDPSFEIQQHLGSKIRNLISQVKASATYKPFVRLFVSQLLQETSHGGGATPVTEGSFHSENMNAAGRVDLLALLQQGDPEKFRRLQSRFFIASNSQQTSKAKDILFDLCHFYKEFVLCADSYAINTHLCNELRGRISDIESQQIQQILDDATAETGNSASVSCAISSLISSARVIGRFLGFVTFEPYNADESLACSYDLSILTFASAALDDALSSNHELATIPWVTEYLKAGKFSTFPLTSEVEALTEKLFNVFVRRGLKGGKDLGAGDLLICLMITGLFDMPIFPDDYFYHLLKKCSGYDHLPKTVCLGSVKKKINNKEEIESTSFDRCCSEIVSFLLIHECNPVLRGIRSSILSCNSGATRSNQSQQPSRKIKPSTEKEREETIIQKKEKQLQHTLEEHFFRGHPSSLKRTVAFVAERCASNCVKRIRSVSMLDICDEAEKVLINRLQATPEPEKLDNYAKGMLTREIVAEMKKIAKDQMHKECDKFCEKAVPQCLENLSSCETADGVLKLATTIARKRAVASVHLWLSTRLDELVSVSVKARLTKVYSSILDTGSTTTLPLSCDYEDDCESFADIDSISSLLQIMKECIMKLTFKSSENANYVVPSICLSLPEKITTNGISHLLRMAHSLLEERDRIFQDKESFASMRRLLHSSPHLKNTLVLTMKELDNRAKFYFGVKQDIFVC